MGELKRWLEFTTKVIPVTREDIGKSETYLYSFFSIVYSPAFFYVIRFPLSTIVILIFFSSPF